MVVGAKTQINVLSTRRSRGCKNRSRCMTSQNRSKPSFVISSLFKPLTIRYFRSSYLCPEFIHIKKLYEYSLINMRQLHILFNSAKRWHVIVCWFLWFSPNLPELRKKLFWTSEQNNFLCSSGRFGGKYRNQQTITCQVLAELNKIWSCLIFTKLYKQF